MDMPNRQITQQEFLEYVEYVFLKNCILSNEILSLSNTIFHNNNNNNNNFIETRLQGTIIGK